MVKHGFARRKLGAGIIAMYSSAEGGTDFIQNGKSTSSRTLSHPKGGFRDEQGIEAYYFYTLVECFPSSAIGGSSDPIERLDVVVWSAGTSHFLIESRNRKATALT